MEQKYEVKIADVNLIKQKTDKEKQDERITEYVINLKDEGNKSNEQNE